MRLTALLLLLFNVAFFAWSRYWPALASSESQLLEQQIRPEAIRLLTPQEVESLRAPRSEASQPAACLEWGPFNVADVQRAREALEQVTLRIEERSVAEPAGWWVFMPPQASRQAIAQKLSELKRLGVGDYFVVQDDPRLRFAISLGVFGSEAAAKSRLEQLRSKGVKTARVGPRRNPVEKTYLQAIDFRDSLRPKLAALHDAFPAVEFRPCPAGDHSLPHDD
jgi:hypothetical protein